jgi:hypothetical protein
LAEKVQRVKVSTWHELADWTEQAYVPGDWRRTVCRSLSTKLEKGTRLKQDENKLLTDLLEKARAKGFEG